MSSNRLAELLKWQSTSVVWDASELGAIFAHQLAAPLELDLKTLDSDVSRIIANRSDTGRPPIETFADLFFHDQPSIELLRLAKGFFKQLGSQPDGPVPREVAAVLYLASIGAAHVRLGERITDTGGSALTTKLKWAVDQQWVSRDMRELLQSALDLLS